MMTRTFTIPWPHPLMFLLIMLSSGASADVRIDSWLTTNSGAYARVYKTTANRTSGTTFTTWTNQSSPVYSDIQMVLSSSNWVYVKYSGLSSYVMGPWLTPQGGVFQFWPTNQHATRRFPRSPVVQAGNKDSTTGGYSGLFVNGVAIFNSLDGQAWNGSSIAGQAPHTQTNYFWHRNAPVAEAFNFDGALGHQPPSAIYHNHQNPIALRYQLGDHVTYNSSTKLYSEITNTLPTAHSPIVGWAHDGYPIYGPYGYSTATDSNSGIRRMIAGYAKRDGTGGADNLSTNLNIVPAWYARFRQKLGTPYSTTASTSRASINATYPLGVFAEDWTYLGDHGKTQGVDFDLDQYNGRYCVTPDFPSGTYAYFTAIDANGNSTYPYILAYEFYGDATGNSVTTISEPVTTNFIGGQNVSIQLNTPTVNSSNSTVTLVWSSVEGGTYQVETSTNQSTWTTLLTNISAKGISTTTNFIGSTGTAYARITRTSLATHDAVYFGGSSTQTDTESYTILGLLEPPAITLSPTNACAQSSGNHASGPDGMTTYLWTIDNGIINDDTEHSQTVSYSAGHSGNVTLILSVTNAFLQTASNSAIVPIAPLPGLSIAIPSSVCANSTGNTASAIGEAAAYAWTISNGTITSATNLQTITFTAGASGNIGLSVTAINSAGCIANDYTEVPITALPDATISSGSATVIPNSATNTVSASAGATSYAWTISNGIITSATNQQTITFTAGDTGQVGLTLTVANNSECTATGSINLPIVLPTYSVISVDFVGGVGGNTTAMSSLESAGVIAATNWNSASNTTGTLTGLLNHAGASTEAGISWNCDIMFSTAVNDTPGDYRMMKGYLDPVTMNATVIVTNIPTAFQSAGYDVIVYCDGGNGTQFRVGKYTIGNTSIFARDAESTDFSGAYIQATSTSDQGNLTSAGNYIRFTGLTNSSFTLTATPASASATILRAPLNAIQIVTLAQPNSAPTLSTISTLSGGVEDTSFSISYSTLKNASDAADANGDALSFRIENISSGTLTKNGIVVTEGVSLLSSGESLDWHPAANANGTLNAFTVRAWDGQLASSSSVQVKVNVTPANDPPAIANTLPELTGTYGTFFTYIFTTNTFSDVDGDALTYSIDVSEAYLYPEWLTFDPESRTLSGTPTESGSFGARIIANDGTQNVSTLAQISIGKATLTVTPANASRHYGEANPTFAGIISGIKNDDNITTTYRTTATSESPAGTYAIIATLNDPDELLVNYNVTIHQGTLTIMDIPLITGEDPRTNSWLTDTAGQYVRLYTNAAAKAAGVTVTTWTFSTINGTNVTGSQAAPVYAGIQEIYSSSNWVYIRSSAMPASPIGPLIAYSPAPLYLPYNQKGIFRVPRNPTIPGSKTLTGGGAIGYLADGVQMFDTRDALSWTGSSEGMGTGYWTRDAYVNEGYGFDPVQGHSSPGGAYHYHSNPAGLRYRMDDHVDYDPSTKTYSESASAVTQHSPILGWVRDGYPLYGPYGYSSASNSASGIRRMISGFVLRNGQNGTANLSVVGRTNIPPWAQRLYGVSSATGPSVASYGPLGRYLEDHDYLGDLINSNTGTNYIKGVDFDLDEYNGRWCVTPEFPNGTYAYFVTINADGTPKYPYYIGRAFYGNPTGGTVSNLTETVITNFVGGTNMPLRMANPSLNDGTVSLTWSAVEGGSYRVESTTNLSAWSTLATNIAPQQIRGAYTTSTDTPNKLYRVARTAVANFDPVNTTTGGGGGGGGNTITMSPVIGNRSTTINVTATISASTTPSAPPAGAPIQSFTIGSLTVSNVSYTTQYQVTGTLPIPANATTGSQTVTITFSPPPGQTSGPTYTQANGFIVQ